MSILTRFPYISHKDKDGFYWCKRLDGKTVYISWTDPTTVDKFCPHDEACSKASGLTPPR